MRTGGECLCVFCLALVTDCWPLTATRQRESASGKSAARQGDTTGGTWNIHRGNPNLSAVPGVTNTALSASASSLLSLASPDHFLGRGCVLPRDVFPLLFVVITSTLEGQCSEGCFSVLANPAQQNVVLSAPCLPQPSCETCLIPDVLHVCPRGEGSFLRKCLFLLGK